MPQRPLTKPLDARFSSGPARKPPSWAAHKLNRALLGRSHRSKDACTRIRQARSRLRALLRIPASHAILFTPGSATGAFETALWNLLASRPVTALAFEKFGRLWLEDATRLKPDVHPRTTPYGLLPPLRDIPADHDLVFTWTGTTSGVCVPGDASWLTSRRKHENRGLTLCDAAAAAAALPLPWPELDAVAFSWQKALGGESQHGVLVLGPRAQCRLRCGPPPWPVPELLRLHDGEEPNQERLGGDAFNTPSLLAVEDLHMCLDWAESVGGLDALTARTRRNRAVLDDWMRGCRWLEHLPQEAALRAPTPFCARLRPASINDDATPQAFMSALAGLLAAEGVARDITAHSSAPPGLRIWTGPTVSHKDLEALTPWLDWAYATLRGTTSATAPSPATASPSRSPGRAVAAS